MLKLSKILFCFFTTQKAPNWWNDQQALSVIAESDILPLTNISMVKFRNSFRIVKVMVKVWDRVKIQNAKRGSSPGIENLTLGAGAHPPSPTPYLMVIALTVAPSDRFSVV